MAGNNEGNEGNEGNFGGGGSGWAGVLPDRVDLPFVAVPGVADKRLGDTIWKPRNWTADWAAWPVLVEFTQSVRLANDAAQKGPDAIWLPPPAEIQAGMPPWKNEPLDDDGELEQLVIAAEDERADALGEIMAQKDGFISYFLAVMSATSNSHPKTYCLLQIASLVGTYVSMHFKALHTRRRPCQRAPGLMPPFQMPGHPSFPSGHATQAHLMAMCVKEAMPPGAGSVREQLGDVLDKLADRIARNREIVGLHFLSDSVGGVQLAETTFGLLKSKAGPNGGLSRFQETLEAAKGEWS